MSSRGTELVNMPVTVQPMGFNAAFMDPDSQKLYNSLTTTHTSGSSLVRKVDSAGLELANEAHTKINAKSCMSYNELLSGLICKDEQLLSKDHVNFMSLSIYDESYKLLQTKMAGKAVLTDKRMLLVSSQYNESFFFEKHGDPKKNSGGYSLSVTCSDSLYYLPIALRCFRSVEIQGDTGVSGSTLINSEYSCCDCCWGCCGCCKDWITAPSVFSEIKGTHLTFGVLMPPWERKTFLRLHFGTNVAIKNIRDMLSLFQNVAPNLD